ncbi:MAG: hypothetical protein HKO03_10875 [Acidimicrobiia bacterium]|nr:hypothetical protein [Acidimicrobiia bacterium]
MHLRPRYLLVIAVLILLGCAESTAQDDIRSFSEIAESEPVIEFDPSGTAATLRVSTNQDAVCAVAYGIDGPFGSIATDTDMGAGGGHDSLSALMTGLQPETEYQYRLQGVAADGFVYRSEIFTFTTPAAVENGIGRNAAIGATIVDVSSEFSSSFAGENAVDGDLGTEWSSAGDGDEAFITIDLGQVTTVNAVSFRTRSMSDGSALTSEFTVEANGETFGPFPAGDLASEVDFEAQILTYRVDTSTGGNTGAVEVAAFTNG